MNNLDKGEIQMRLISVSITPKCMKARGKVHKWVSSSAQKREREERDKAFMSWNKSNDI